MSNRTFVVRLDPEQGDPVAYLTDLLVTVYPSGECEIAFRPIGAEVWGRPRRAT